MSRPLRIEYEGAWYHVMNRGIARQAIYLKDGHRNMFLDLLEEISKKFYVEIHAYCLMDNHYHLLMRTPIPNLGKAMRHLDGIYTRRFNICQKRDGSIFRGRYRAILIEEDQYLLQVSRYIHLNPVVAKICEVPGEYPWSSYRYFLNKSSYCKWLRTDNILTYFDDPIAYAKFVAEGLDVELEDFYNQKTKTILGTDKFISDALVKITESQKNFCKTDINRFKKIYSIESIITIIKKYFNVEIDHLKNSTRGKKNIPRIFAMFFTKQYGQLTHQQIANYFTNINSKSVGTLTDRLQLLIKNNNEMQKYFEDISYLLGASS
ncbi:MAG: transposase [Gammaproteobacteria bacterium]